MPEPADLLITHVHLFTLAGEGVGYLEEGAVAAERAGRGLNTGRTLANRIPAAYRTPSRAEI